MKIAYVLTSDTAHFLGSTKKIKNQVDFWRNSGETVEVFARTPNNSPSILESRRYVLKRGFFLDTVLVCRQMLSDIEAYGPDIVYFRYGNVNATYLAILKKYKGIIEVNTDDISEYRSLFKNKTSIGTFFRLVYGTFSKKLFFRNAIAGVFLTYELARNTHESRYLRFSSVIPNSIPYDPDGRDIQKGKSSFGDGRIHLFFIGSPGMSWHGTDKLQMLAHRLGTGFYIHIVGVQGENESNLMYYGYLKESDYRFILEKCHVCLGTFALHRKNMNEACTLKVREYIRAGFPVILAYRETPFARTGNPPYILEIPNHEESISDETNVEMIRTFCFEQKDRIVSHEESWEYFSSDRIEKERLGFLHEVADEN